MQLKRRRFSIRAQLTVIVLVAAFVSTIATLYIANNAIQSYVIDQARQRENNNLKVAWLVLQTEFGDNVSIDVKGRLVADSPLTASASGLGQGNVNNFLPYPLNGDVDYVDEVHHLVNGVVAVYQCANERGDLLPGGKCQRIATDIPKLANGQEQPGTRNLDDPLNDPIFTYVKTHSDPYVLEDTVSGIPYVAAYQAMYNPQHDFIGVLFVGEPLAGVQTLIRTTTLQLALVGLLIMVGGAILAILLAQAITGTLQNAAQQVSSASTKFSGIAAQQASGSAQQVWAIDAISQALRNLSETATEVAKRADQLAQMGSQVLQRRSEISPSQIDSIINYITRSTHDISVQSRQQASTCERMNGAMQAVMEVAQQVERDSQQTTDGAERLAQVVQQLQRLVGTNEAKTTPMLMADKSNTPTSNKSASRANTGAPGSAPLSAPATTVSSIRSARPAQSISASNPTPQWPTLSNPPSGPLTMQPTNKPSFSSGTRPPTAPQQTPTRSGALSETPDRRSGALRPPAHYGTSGEPGPFPPLDSRTMPPDRNHPSDNRNLPPTYPPTRRDPRERK